MAQAKDGTLWAIQAKAYAPENAVTKQDMDFCGGQKSREKRGSRRSLSTNFHRLITTPTALGLLVSALGGTDRQHPAAGALFHDRGT